MSLRSDKQGTEDADVGADFQACNEESERMQPAGDHRNQEDVTND